MLNDTMPREMTPAGRHLDPVDQMRRTQADFNRLFGGLRFYPGSEFSLLNLRTSPDGAIVVAEGNRIWRARQEPGAILPHVPITLPDGGQNDISVFWRRSRQD